jgi:hypothetical protein
MPLVSLAIGMEEVRQKVHPMRVRLEEVPDVVSLSTALRKEIDFLHLAWVPEAVPPIAPWDYTQMEEVRRKRNQNLVFLAKVPNVVSPSNALRTQIHLARLAEVPWVLPLTALGSNIDFVHLPDCEDLLGLYKALANALGTFQASLRWLLREKCSLLLGPMPLVNI